jgi:hypothetical protein
MARHAPLLRQPEECIAHGGRAALRRFTEGDEVVDHVHQNTERVKVAGRAVHPLWLFLHNFVANRAHCVPVPVDDSHR